jgi:hypothetical protein
MILSFEVYLNPSSKSKPLPKVKRSPASRPASLNKLFFTLFFNSLPLSKNPDAQPEKTLTSTANKRINLPLRNNLLNLKFRNGKQAF